MRIFSQLPDHTLCISETCTGFHQPPELALCVMGLVCTCLSLPGHLLLSQGLCALISAHQPLCFTGLVFGSLVQPRCCRACVFFGLPRPHLHPEVCVHWRGLYATPFLATWACPLHPMVCVHWRGLYAVPLSATQACLLHCKGCVRCRGLYAAPL